MREFVVVMLVAITLTAGLEVLSRTSNSPAPASQASAPSYLQTILEGRGESPAYVLPPSTTGDLDGNVFMLVDGWYRDREIRYYDFGGNTALTQSRSVAVAPIFVFTTGVDAAGNPELVEGQHNIVDVRPGDAGYSDLWQVVLVTAPKDYEPNSVKSARDVLSSGLQLTKTDILVNCPIVPNGTKLEGGEPLIQGWYRNKAVFYPDFGPNPATAIPVFAFVTGLDSDGNPQYLESQLNIVDSVPEDSNYSDFWRLNLVTVPVDYEPNSIKSVADLRSSGFEVTETSIVLNSPIVAVQGTESSTTRR